MRITLRCVAALMTTALGMPAAVDAGGSSEDADRTAVKKSAKDFARAFAKGDAKAIAAFWTEKGEYHTEGIAVRGRAAIEEGFANFFKEHPGHKVEMKIESIRFPSANLAIEEGIVRQLGNGKDLPGSSLYRVTHVREAGGWKIAVAREWGGNQDRLADLDWLVGKWKGSQQDQEVTLTFAWDAKNPLLVAEFEKTVKGKVASTGSMKIGADPQRPGQLRSWHFDDDGGHGQALWFRDGSRWVLDALGVSGAGVNTASVNLLSRINGDAFTWRSIDRVAGGRPMPDTTPIKLTRVVVTK
jgi:uncharacterized protein (TIGR02246 family)